MEYMDWPNLLTFFMFFFYGCEENFARSAKNYNYLLLKNESFDTLMNKFNYISIDFSLKTTFYLKITVFVAKKCQLIDYDNKNLLNAFKSSLRRKLKK